MKVDISIATDKEGELKIVCDYCCVSIVEERVYKIREWINEHESRCKADHIVRML